MIHGAYRYILNTSASWSDCWPRQEPKGAGRSESRSACSDAQRSSREVCWRKIEMTTGAQSRHDTAWAADTASATRHRRHTLGEGAGVKGRSRRQPVCRVQPSRPLSLPAEHQRLAVISLFAVRRTAPRPIHPAFQCCCFAEEVRQPQQSPPRCPRCCRVRRASDPGSTAPASRRAMLRSLR